MKKLATLIVGFIFIKCSILSYAQKNDNILPAASCMENYLPLLEGKKIALVINQTSVVGNQNLLDTLLKKGINIINIFVPEHGFRGTADAGTHINNEIDAATNIPIYSLYGNNKKPKPEQLKDVDILVYDLQDVGARFFTYISTLEYLMEACTENNVELLILDRPNPNGFYVDGPILEPKYKSFIGMQKIPVVYGMTVAEYAQMLQGEKWINNIQNLKLTIIKCKHYDHNKLYSLPVPPSPNLKNMTAVYLYPSLCFFEGTVVSVGRGTDKPFQQYGHPIYINKTRYFFIPKSKIGASKPMLEGELCYGEIVAEKPEDALKLINKKIQLKWLIKSYEWYPEKKTFFIPFINNLAGTQNLQQQICSGINEQHIRKSWQRDLKAFKKIRKKYLLYKDFE